MGLLDMPGQQPQRYGLLDPNVMGLIQSGGPRVAPAPVAPQRPRVSGWRVFDRVLGGQTVTEGLDAERARLEAEARAPQERLLAQRELDIAQQFGGGPAWLALRANREEFGGQLSRQFAPQTLAEGSASVTPGMINGAPIMNERRAVVGDRVVGMGGPGQDPRELLTVGPSFSDQTNRDKLEIDRITANRPIELAPGERALNRDGTEFGRGADRIFSAADGTDLVGEGGNQVYQNQRDAPTTPTPASVELQGQLAALDTDVDPVLNEMVSMLDSGDVITGLGADQRLLAARAAAAVGNADARRQVAATERYLNMAGRLRVGMAKSLGANPSNADLTVLQSVTAGDLGQSADGLRATLRDGQALSQRQRGALRARVAPVAPAAAPAQGQPVRIYNDDDYARLPSGATFQGPDGVTRRKP